MTRRSPGGRFPIPSAPPAAILLAHQVALIERARAVLRLRAREKRGPAPPEAYEAVRLAQAALAELRGAHRFPFDDLCDALGLDGVLREALALAAAPHLDETLRDDIRAYRGDAARGYVDAALVVDLYCARRDELLAKARQLGYDSGLVDAGLLDLATPRAHHAVSRLELELVPTPRLLGLLRGEVVVDPRIEECAGLCAVDVRDAEGIVPEEELADVRARFQAAVGPFSERRAARLAVRGDAGLGKTRLAAALAAGAGFDYLLEVDPLLLPRSPEDLSARLALLDREARIHNALLLFRCRALPAERLGLAVTLAERVKSAIVWTTQGDEDAFGRLHGAFAVRRPPPALREQAWRAALSAHPVAIDSDAIVTLAGELPACRAEIELAVDMACRLAGPRAVTPALLAKTGREQLTSHLARFARRARSRAVLADLVLPEYVADGVREIIEAVRNRAGVLGALEDAGLPVARGIVALFNGPPGTGKTLSANAIANAVGAPLYRIDVSSLLDRYIGETEKKLARLFEEAATDRVVLLFDEADSLLSKRVEVRDATDRYANGQINLLLNLIEDYEGLVILTTNLKASLEPALMRRITFKLEFPLPEEGERLALWRAHLRGSRLEDDVDLGRLAGEHKVGGGVIRNVALRAALMAGGSRPLSDTALRRALRAELEASGNVVRHI